MEEQFDYRKFYEAERYLVDEIGAIAAAVKARWAKAKAKKA
jgi:hypothetical protein